MDNIRKQSIYRFIAIYLITGGVYGMYWLLSRGYKIYFTDNKSIKKVLYILLLGCLAIFFCLLIFGPMYFEDGISGLNLIKNLFLIEFSLAIFIYIGMSVVALDIADTICSRWRSQEQTKQCSPLKAFFFTYLGFLSALYLQIKINKLKK